MAASRRFFADYWTSGAVLMAAIVATWCCPIQAQEETKAFGIQIGIDGGDVPFVKPFVAQWFGVGDELCADGEQCQDVVHSISNCESKIAEAIAHFCTGAETCVVCPETVVQQTACPEVCCKENNAVAADCQPPYEVFEYQTVVAHHGEVFPPGHHPLFDALIEALSAKAALEAEIAAQHHQREFAAELAAKEAENAELRAALEIAEQRHQWQKELAEMMAEKVRLQAEVELAKQRQQFVEQYAQMVSAHHATVAEQAKAKLTKAKSKHGQAKNHSQIAKSKKGHGKIAKAKKDGKVAKSKKGQKDFRTAKQPETKAGEKEQSR